MAAAVGSRKALWGPSNVGFEILTSRRRSDGVGQPTAMSGRLGLLPEAATQLECKTSAFLCPLHIEGRGSDPDVRMPCASR